MGLVSHLAGEIPLTRSTDPTRPTRMLMLQLVHQFYFYVVLSGYSRGQQEDHLRYDSLYSMNGVNNIPMTKRDPWEARDESPSPPLGGGGPSGRDGYSHVRNVSNVSEDAMLSDAYPRQPFPDYPQNARTYEAQPTPFYSDPYYNNNAQGASSGTGLNRPEHAQAHPGQSSP